MSYIPLHIRTGYTFLKSGITIPKLIKFAKECNFKYLGISDLNVMYGFPKFNELCLKSGITPLFGMDVEIGENIISLFVQNEVGYINLCHLSSYIQRGNILDLDTLKNYTEGLKAVFPISNKLFASVDENTFSTALFKYSKIFKEFFIGIEIYTKEEVKKADLIRSFAQQYSYQCIAFPKVQYLKKSDAIVTQLLKAIEIQSTTDYKEIPVDSHYFLKTNEEITKFYSPSELENCALLLENYDFNLKIKRGKLLHYDPLKNSDELLISKLHKGLKFRNIELENNKVYRDRLNYEYLTIKKMGYSDYFLIVQDYVNYAKNNNIPVGPGRGSAAGSLISYLLNITDVDPLKYDLLFERFLNPQRKSMPDIDVDFSDLKRDLVFEYLKKKYSYKRCARVIAFQTFGAKQALRDITKAIGFPNNIADQISKTIPANFNANNFDLDYAYEHIPAFKAIIDSTPDYSIIFNLAHLIEGLPRQKGLHAAGLIIDNEELENSIPLTYEGENEQVTQYEKDYLEEQGFLKMDLLGLTNLSTIEACIENVKKNRNIDIDLSKISLDDPKIYNLIKSGSTMGLFQLDTSAANNALGYIKPSKFMDVVATISLDRPGPMEQIPLYSRRKERKEKVTYIDKSLGPILKETYGIIVYQEQIMQICRVFAGFSYAEADLFRRAISKKHQSELLKLKDSFTLGAQKKGHDLKTINEIYNLILKFASYGFNKSHAVSYAMIACQEAYLKANYGPEFYIAILDQQYGSNDAKFSKYVSEIKKAKINLLLPSINKSGANFSLENGSLRMPLLGISGFPSLVTFNIINERNKNGEFKDFIDFVLRMYRTPDKISETNLAKLVDAGCFDELYPNRKSLKMSITPALSYASATIYNENSLFEDFGLKFDYIETKDDPEERIANELNSIGVMISDSPLRHVDLSRYKKLVITPISELKNNVTSYILVIINSIKTIQVKNGKDKGKPMAFLGVFDESGEIDVTVFADDYAKNINNIVKNNILLIKGKVQPRDGKISFNLENMMNVKE